MTQTLQEKIDEAKADWEKMTPSQKLRSRYEQRRSFARGMCPDNKDYLAHCIDVDRLNPPAAELTDAEIGCVILGIPVR